LFGLFALGLIAELCGKDPGWEHALVLAAIFTGPACLLATAVLESFD